MEIHDRSLPDLVGVLAMKSFQEASRAHLGTET
jgi:hypothetical protein